MSLHLRHSAILLQQIFLPLQLPVYPQVIHSLSEIISVPHQTGQRYERNQGYTIAGHSLQDKVSCQSACSPEKCPQRGQKFVMLAGAAASFPNRLGILHSTAKKVHTGRTSAQAVQQLQLAAQQAHTVLGVRQDMYAFQ